MSRWTKRQQQTVVPLDNLLREKENKNSVAVGTVMKFGVMQFTSIRSSCYSKLIVLLNISLLLMIFLF